MENDSSKKAVFEALVKANMKRAYYSALGIMGCHDLAMELSQEAFLRAYKHFDRYDAAKPFFTWYYKILRNLCLNAIRDNKNRRESFLDNVSELELAADPSGNYEDNESREQLEEAIMRLDPESREIITLKEFEGQSYKEISELLSLPVGTVMSRLYYARKKLSRILKGMME